MKFRLIVLCLGAATLLPVKGETDAPAPVDSVAATTAVDVQPAPVNAVDIGAATGSEDRPSVEIRAGDAVSSVPKKFQYAARLNLRSVYDDNIYLRHDAPIGDVYFAIEPGITLGFGDIVGTDMNSIRLDYAPSFFIYGNHSNANAVQQLMRLDGRYHMGRLNLTLSQEVQLLEGTTNPGALNFGSNTSPTPTLNLDTGGSASVNIYTTNANFSYDLTGKTFLSGGFNFSAYDYQQLISSEQAQGNLFLNFTYSPKLTLGLGGTLGYNWVEANNPNQIFEQANLRGTYQLTGKISVDGSVGYEFRQFENDARGGGYTSPVYEIGATYQPFDGTTVNLRGNRRTQNSAVLSGQDYSTTNINISVRQRFLRRIYFGLTGGYERSDYFNTVQFVSADRSDNYYFIEPSIDFTITRYWTAGAYYLHRRDDSSFAAYSFYDNQVGFRTSLTF